MAYSSRRQRRPGIDIWPGFVDALTQLVMIIIFVLLVFTAGQFYLTSALSGRDAALAQRDAALAQLTERINALTDLLSLGAKQRKSASAPATPALIRIAADKADLYFG